MTLYLVMLLLAVFVPSWGIVISVRAMTGKAVLISRSEKASLAFAALPPEIKQFISSHGMTQTDILRYAQIPFVVYRMTQDISPERSFVVMAARGTYVCDICTDFSNEHSLTTTRSANGFVHPRAPGAYLQGFTRISLDELWSRHLAAELFLLKNGLANAGPLEPDIARRIETALRRQGAAIKATSLYWLKAPYWFYLKRHLMVNKPVAQQVSLRT